MQNTIDFHFQPRIEHVANSRTNSSNVDKIRDLQQLFNTAHLSDKLIVFSDTCDGFFNILES